MTSGRIFIGTSGWSYAHWANRFYPPDLPRRQWLAWYARHFNAVEINASFYRLPEEETLVQWSQQVHEGFLFACKASRYITHMKKLHAVDQALQHFMERVALLGTRLGPILFQLPPHWNFNASRLRDFLQALPRDLQVAIEFRDRRWINPTTLALLAEHEAAFCIHDFGGEWTPPEVTSDLVYLRFHGPLPGYRGRYADKVLGQWSARIRQWHADGHEIHAYFNNDTDAQAVEDAQRLARMTRPVGNNPDAPLWVH